MDLMHLESILDSEKGFVEALIQTDKKYASNYLEYCFRDSVFFQIFNDEEAELLHKVERELYDKLFPAPVVDFGVEAFPGVKS